MYVFNKPLTEVIADLRAGIELQHDVAQRIGRTIAQDMLLARVRLLRNELRCLETVERRAAQEMGCEAGQLSPGRTDATATPAACRGQRSGAPGDQLPWAATCLGAMMFCACKKARTKTDQQQCLFLPVKRRLPGWSGLYAVTMVDRERTREA